MSGWSVWRGRASIGVLAVGVALAGAGAQAQDTGRLQDTTGGPSVDSVGNPAPLEPDPRLTPGDTLAVTAQDICTPGYSHKVRNVPLPVKRAAYAAYGIVAHQPGEYEVDHLISLELGGSNSIRNLWPESFWTAPWNAHVKDALENELHREVCAGQLDLHSAQRDIARDWIAAYKQYFHRALPRAGRARRVSGGGVRGGVSGAGLRSRLR